MHQCRSAIGGCYLAPISPGMEFPRGVERAVKVQKEQQFRHDGCVLGVGSVSLRHRAGMIEPYDSLRGHRAGRCRGSTGGLPQRIRNPVGWRLHWQQGSSRNHLAKATSLAPEANWRTHQGARVPSRSSNCCVLTIRRNRIRVRSAIHASPRSGHWRRPSAKAGNALVAVARRRPAGRRIQARGPGCHNWRRICSEYHRCQ